ncbi:uncharacterized protein OCT59_001315 [Rhizophagus irregularis]|nr:hypothetical protein OCT59_001315 [Rhizophagus irregularis]
MASQMKWKQENSFLSEMDTRLMASCRTLHLVLCFHGKNYYFGG